MRSNSLEVFCCCVRTDLDLLEALRIHLAPLEKRDMINLWSEWGRELDRHLESADIILLLISPDFMNSNSCYNEMVRAIERHRQGSARVIPILLRPTPLLKKAPFAKFQVLPTNALPVTKWSDPNDAFHNITVQIEDIASQFQAERERTPVEAERPFNIPPVSPRKKILTRKNALIVLTLLIIAGGLFYGLSDNGKSTATQQPIKGITIAPSPTAQPTIAPSPTAQPTGAPSPTAQPTGAPSPTAQPTGAPSPSTLHDSMFGSDAQHTHNNPSENKVSASNVSRLHLAWKFPIGPSIGPPSGNYPISQSSPVVANGIVYIGSWDNNLYAIDARSGHLKWGPISTSDRIDSSPAVVDGTVYIGSNDDKFYAFDAESGHLKWGPISTDNRIDCPPVVADGTVYVGSTDGHLYAFDARTGNQQWKSTDTGSSTYFFSSPAVANGVVYIGSWDGNLRAFDATNGHEKWFIPINGASPSSTKEVGKGGTFSSPAVVNGVVYIGSQDGNLYAFDAMSGQPKWKASTGGRIDSSPAVVDGIVYIGSQDNNLYAFDAMSGQQKWAVPVDGPISSSPMVANGLVYIGSDNNQIYAFDALTGNREWSAPTGNSSSPMANVIYSSPAIADGKVYIGSTDGYLYAFSL